MPECYNRTLCGALLTYILSVSACQSDTIDDSNPVGPDDRVMFAQNILPLLTSSCAGDACHIGQTTSGVNLSDHTRILASTGLQYGRRIITRSDAQNSPIINKLRPQPEFGSRMPLGGRALTSSNIALIEAWINDGALKN